MRKLDESHKDKFLQLNTENTVRQMKRWYEAQSQTSLNEYAHNMKNSAGDDLDKWLELISLQFSVDDVEVKYKPLNDALEHGILALNSKYKMDDAKDIYDASAIGSVYE